MSTNHIEQSFRDWLIADTTITDLIGAAAASRLYPGHIPQGQAMPAVRYIRITEEQERDLSVTALQTFSSVFQIDCYATAYDTAIALAEAINDRMIAWEATKTNDSVNYIQYVERSAYEQNYDEPPDGSDTGRYMVSQDFRLFYERV